MLSSLVEYPNENTLKRTEVLFGARGLWLPPLVSFDFRGTSDRHLENSLVVLSQPQ